VDIIVCSRSKWKVFVSALHKEFNVLPEVGMMKWSGLDLSSFVLEMNHFLHIRVLFRSDFDDVKSVLNQLKCSPLKHSNIHEYVGQSLAQIGSDWSDLVIGKITKSKFSDNVLQELMNSRRYDVVQTYKYRKHDEELIGADFAKNDTACIQNLYHPVPVFTKFDNVEKYTAWWNNNIWTI
jgi:hypothetical protein